MKYNKTKIYNIFSVALLIPLLLPRITKSTGYEQYIYGSTLILILIIKIWSINFTINSVFSLASATGCFVLGITSTLLQGNIIDHKLFLFAITLMLFAFHKNSYFISYFLYTFSVISVLLATPISFLDNSSLIIPASTYPVFNIDRITFFFEEPSHYSVILALSFGLGQKMKKPQWMQLILLSGIVLTFSASGFILLLTVYIINQIGSNPKLKSAIFFLTAIIITAIIGLPYLSNIDSSGVISTRLNQLEDGIDSGVNYSSTGVRIASALAGIDFLSKSFQDSNLLAIIFGIGFDGLQDFVGKYYSTYFIELVDTKMIFNFISASVISGGILGTFLYLLSLENIRRSNRISIFKWIFLVLFMSLTHGYLYGPMAYIFFVFASIAISTPRDFFTASTCLENQ